MAVVGAIREPESGQAARRQYVDPALLFGAERSAPTTLAQREVLRNAGTDTQAACSFTHSISVFLEGELHLDALYSALLALIERHEALRGRLSRDGQTFLVRERIGFELPVVDLSGCDAAQYQSRYEDLIRIEVERPFDLFEGPLFRALLVRASASRATLVFSCHQVGVDGWSLNVILAELPRLYSALAQGRDDAGLAPAASFVDYLALAGAREARSSGPVRRYWHEVYPGPAPVLELPLDHARPRLRDLASRRIDYRVGKAVAQALKRAGARGGCSQFIGLLAAYAVFLGRISAQDDLVVAVPAAGQIGSGKAPLLGSDTRLMPVRCTLREGDTFTGFAGRLMDHFLAAYEHQWVALGDLVTELGVAVDPARAPLAAVLFSFDPGMKPEDFQFAA